MKSRSAQKVSQAYEQKERGSSGRFGKLNPCYGCGKSAGQDYFSHPLTGGVLWADLALVLCERCAEATERMFDPRDFVAYALEHKALSAKGAARVKESIEKDLLAEPMLLEQAKAYIVKVFGGTR